MSDVKQAYAASSAVTVTLASLATSSTFVAGRESTAIDNTTNLYKDYGLAGKVTTGTSPTTGKEIRIYVAALLDDSTWPDVLDGTDSAETWTSADILASSAVLVASMATDATSDRTYPFSVKSVRRAFGDFMPKKFVVFVAHNTGVNLNSTAGNHAIYISHAYETVV